MNLLDFLRRFFPRVTRYRVLPRVLRSMRAFARQTHPKEMIALLRGRREGFTLVIEELVFQPFENTAWSATIHLDSTLTNIVGTFHSHPSPDDRPSAADRRLFAEHPGVHAIASYPYDTVAFYTHRSRFLGRERVLGRKRTGNSFRRARVSSRREARERPRVRGRPR